MRCKAEFNLVKDVRCADLNHRCNRLIKYLYIKTLQFSFVKTNKRTRIFVKTKIAYLSF